MSERIRIVVDAMGGDYAPAEPVRGAVDAVRDIDRIEVILTGDEQAIRKELDSLSYPEDRIRIHPTTEVIETAEPPVKAIQTKKDSSLVVGLQLVHQGEADAFVSSGNTGAVLVGGQAIVKKIRGVARAPLAPLIPTKQGASLLIDCGANVDARAQHLLQFAIMGSLYMKEIRGIENPRVGLINIGAEEEKGNALCKEAFPLLKACEEIHFIGNVEARDIPEGVADVYVTEAFVGNVLLKLYEGVGKTLLGEMKGALLSSTRSKIGALMIKPALKKALGKYDSSRYGGAPLLGLRGLVAKTHGSSKALEFRNTIAECVRFSEQGLVAKIGDLLRRKDEGAENAPSHRVTM